MTPPINNKEYEEQALAKRKEVEYKLAHAPAMEFSNEETWQNFKQQNSGKEGEAIIVYSECWARLMQAEMVKGQCIIDVVEVTSYESAYIENITSLMELYAVYILGVSWKYGDQLRRWHNGFWQIRNEGENANESGGILNPVILLFS